MLISHEHRFIFFHVPKTGGKSVTRALLPYAHIAVDFGNPFSRRLFRNAVERHRNALCATKTGESMAPAVQEDLWRAMRRAAKLEQWLAPHRPKTGFRVAGWLLQLMASPRAFVTSFDRTPDYPKTLQLSLVHTHDPVANYRSLLPPEMFEGYFKFAFVREPLTLLISLYRFLNSIWSSGMPVEQMRQFEGLAYLTRDCRGLSFAEFAARSCEGRGGVFEALGVDPRAPQRDILADADGNLLVDFVGKQERLTDDFRTVCQKIGLAVELPRINVSDATPLDPPGEELVRMVRSACAGDYEAFGY